MIYVKEHLNLLGFTVQDRVTGFCGVVTTIGFDLYGCIQALVNPGVDKDGKCREQTWFDVNRLNVLSPNPVMDRPNFDCGLVAEGKKGAAEKPSCTKS